MVSKLGLWISSLSARNAASLAAAASSSSPPARRLARQPGEESGQRRAVAPVGFTGAVELDRVLDRLGKGARIGRVAGLGAAVAQPSRDPRRRRRGIDGDRFPGPSELVQRIPERGAVANPHPATEMPAHAGGQLAPVDQQIDGGVGMQDREAERERRAGDVGAAQVQQPGERVRRRHYRGIGLRLDQRPRQPPALVGAGFAGKAQRMRDSRRDGRRRPVRPHRVHGVGGDGNELRAGRPACGRKRARLVLAVQPRVVAEPRPGIEVAGKPTPPGLLDDMVEGVQRARNLLARLQGVAAVDEQGRPGPQHHRGPGRSGEAGEPGQALRPQGHELGVVLIAERDDEAVETAPGELGAHGGEARRRIRGLERRPIAGRGGGDPLVQGSGEPGARPAPEQLRPPLPGEAGFRRRRDAGDEVGEGVAVDGERHRQRAKLLFVRLPTHDKIRSPRPRPPSSRATAYPAKFLPAPVCGCADRGRAVWRRRATYRGLPRRDEPGG